MNLATISLAYLKARSLNTLLNILLLALGVATIVLLLLATTQLDQRMRRDAQGIDLVVGAKGSPMQVILSSIYHLDVPTGNIPYKQALEISKHRAVKKAIPLALGDSHRGFAVLGTTPGYFEHFRYGARQPLVLAQGRAFGAGADAGADGVHEAVIGAEVARRLGYGLGQKIVLAQIGRAHV